MIEGQSLNQQGWSSCLHVEASPCWASWCLHLPLIQLVVGWALL